MASVFPWASVAGSVTAVFAGADYLPGHHYAYSANFQTVVCRRAGTSVGVRLLTVTPGMLHQVSEKSNGCGCNDRRRVIRTVSVCVSVAVSQTRVAVYVTMVFPPGNIPSRDAISNYRCCCGASNRVRYDRTQLVHQLSRHDVRAICRRYGGRLSVTVTS